MTLNELQKQHSHKQETLYGGREIFYHFNHLQIEILGTTAIHYFREFMSL
jgi:hypothetical protein